MQFCSLTGFDTTFLSELGSDLNGGTVPSLRAFASSACLLPGIMVILLLIDSITSIDIVFDIKFN
jgi:hypothetical protein